MTTGLAAPVLCCMYPVSREATNDMAGSESTIVTQNSSSQNKELHTLLKDVSVKSFLGFYLFPFSKIIIKLKLIDMFFLLIKYKHFYI